ncbi:MAG: lipocalin family protein [Bacteriovoracaceae bacterium]|nr:lipocalin family protein [Bacteriovoracaceae bacterium]
MKPIFYLSVLFAASLCHPIFMTSSVAQTPAPDAKVDLTRYLGTWYEIASIPQRFSKGCNCTRAVYSAKKNPSKIGVFNSCNKNSVQGRLSKIHGVAKIKDKNSNAKLRVTFFWPFGGAYWIIGLAEDYRYAVVSNGEGSTLWILSRTPQMNKVDLEEALEITTKNGIDVGRLNYTVQEGCRYP